MDNSSFEKFADDRHERLGVRSRAGSVCGDDANDTAAPNATTDICCGNQPEIGNVELPDDCPPGLVAADQAAGSQIASRLREGTLFGSALHRYARLMQIDKKTRCSIVERLRDEFRELCPEGVSPIEVESAERVIIAKVKTLVLDNLMADPRNWDDPKDKIQKMQNHASRELDRAMRLLMTLRKVATAQPGFRVVASQTEQRDGRTRTRSVSYEQLPDDVSAMLEASS